MDPRPLDPPTYWDSYYALTDEELAAEYVYHFEDVGSSWFHAIHREAEARGLTLEDLEELHFSQFDPPCSLDS